MIVYQSTKEGFINDVTFNKITDKVHEAFLAHIGRDTSRNEINSWTNSLLRMNNVLLDDEIPKDAGVSIEFQIPLTSKRIDFIISGMDSEKQDNAVIIELKQWSKVEMTNMDAIVRTRFQTGEANTTHPSYQAWSYVSTLYNFNENISTENIKLTPCAFLHNYTADGIIDNAFYSYYIEKAPLFFSQDVLKLREFIKRHVKYGDNRDIIYKIENGRIRPSKHLADALSSMIEGKKEFDLLDDQKGVYEMALKMADMASVNKKRVLVVEGGPGTGKSVLAINLLVTLLQKEYLTKYISKNSAPRSVYTAKLSGTHRLTDINNLFGGSGSFYDTPKDTFDVLIVDEAHRLNLKSGLYQNKGENQVQEIINAAKFTIFFVDNEQKIHIKDIGSKEYIEEIANINQAYVETMKLQSQFRCNGSDGYLAWLDNTLQIRDTANFKLNSDDFDFRIYQNPNELRNAIFEKNGNNKSRMVAGYCWDWKSKKDSKQFDVVIPEHNFKMQWNFADDNTWLISPDSINQIGCIHTCQGLELDYVGVIIGPDIRFEDGKVVTDFNRRSSNDRSISGMKSMYHKNPIEAKSLADSII